MKSTVMIHRYLKFFLALYLLIFPFRSAYGLSPKELAQGAEQEYQKGHYSNALKNWEELSSLGYTNGNLFYDMGSAYWRLGQVGQARRYFLKASRWNPRDSATRENLSFIKGKLEEGPRERGLLFLLKKLPWWRLSLNIPDSLKMTAISSGALFGILLWSKLRKKKSKPFLIVILFFCAFYSGLQLVSRVGGGYFNKQAVILESKVPLLKIPAKEVLSGQELSEGTLVSIEKAQGDFRLVKTAAGRKGWVEFQQIGEI